MEVGILKSAVAAFGYAVADGIGGVIIAVADIDAVPERVFRALTNDEVEKWDAVVRSRDGGAANQPKRMAETVMPMMSSRKTDSPRSFPAAPAATISGRRCSSRG